MKTKLILAVAPAVLLVISGCQTPASRSTAAVPLAGTKWVLTELNGKPFVATETLRAPTLKLDAATKQAAGISGINRFAGGYELDGTKLKFGVFLGTRMAGPPEAMASEETFLGALQRVSSWKASGNMLELRDGETTLLKFTAH